MLIQQGVPFSRDMTKMGDLCKELLIRAYLYIFVTCSKPIETLDIIAFSLKTVVTRAASNPASFFCKSINSNLLGPVFLSECVKKAGQVHCAGVVFPWFPHGTQMDTMSH